MPRQHEIEAVRDELTQEVNMDSKVLAKQLFGTPAPDVARVSDEQLMNTYRRAYQSGDRKFLQAEARRDPQQFLKIAERLGVMVPSPPAAPPPAAAPTAGPLPVTPAQVPGPAGQILGQLLGPQPPQSPPPGLPPPPILGP
jgi:hypothetical protein